MPAFLDSGDDGPGFEYFEEPDFDDDSTDAGEGGQQPPDEPARDGGGVGTQGTRNGRPLPASARVLSPPEMSPPPPVTPRPKIVTAREQQQREKTREDARRRSRESRGGSDSGGGGGGGGDGGCEVADIEGDFGGGIGGSGSGWKGKKRGRSKIGSPGQKFCDATSRRMVFLGTSSPRFVHIERKCSARGRGRLTIGANARTYLGGWLECPAGCAARSFASL